MRVKFIVPILFLSILIFFLLNFLFTSKLFPEYKTQKLKVYNQTLKLYIADTDEKRELGLSHIKHLPENEGMIFTYPTAGQYYFWMKDMNIPLDFVFLNDNAVITLYKNIKASSYPKTYTSNKLADKIIELNAGMIDKLKIKVRDKINIK